MPRKTSSGKRIIQFRIVDEDGNNDLRGFMNLWKQIHIKDGSLDDLVKAVRKEYGHRNEKGASFTAAKCEAKMRKLITKAEGLAKSNRQVSIPPELRGMGSEKESASEILADFDW